MKSFVWMLFVCANLVRDADAGAAASNADRLVKEWEARYPKEAKERIPE